MIRGVGEYSSLSAAWGGGGYGSRDIWNEERERSDMYKDNDLQIRTKMAILINRKRTIRKHNAQ
jgi:hypothetical protein